MNVIRRVTCSRRSVTIVRWPATLSRRWLECLQHQRADPVHGIGAWPTDVLANYPERRAAPGLGLSAGPMTEVVEHSLRYLTDADRHAIAVFKDSPARSEGAARPQQAAP